MDLEAQHCFRNMTERHLAVGRKGVNDLSAENQIRQRIYPEPQPYLTMTLACGKYP